MSKVEESTESNREKLLSVETKPDTTNQAANPKCPPTINTCNTAWEITKFSVWPIIGMMFHPMYSVINAAVVG